ncbi:MAG: nucleoside triphosphate pyrophosphohydrolase [Fibrobacterales bacterium]
MEQKKYTFQELIDIMARLRGKDGCPWDREQTHESLLQYLIEETAEFIDGVQNGDDAEMCDELGDVLLQVIFHAQIAEEENRFAIEDVISAISNKMVHRHPHVFGDLKLNTSDDVLNNWDSFKQVEKEKRGITEEKTIMKGLPKTMPALSLAKKIQNRAAKVGFDWPNADGVYEKITEEIDEFKAEIKTDIDRPEALYEQNAPVSDAAEEEFGDILFSVVNLGRKYGIDPEIALRKANNKFVGRFKQMEKISENELNSQTLEELDQLWNRVKQINQ